jgi:hypothetical protein
MQSNAVCGHSNPPSLRRLLEQLNYNTDSNFAMQIVPGLPTKHGPRRSPLVEIGQCPTTQHRASWRTHYLLLPPVFSRDLVTRRCLGASRVPLARILPSLSSCFCAVLAL